MKSKDTICIFLSRSRRLRQTISFNPAFLSPDFLCFRLLTDLEKIFSPDHKKCVCLVEKSVLYKIPTGYSGILFHLLKEAGSLLAE